jgi:hypothetical protein
MSATASLPAALALAEEYGLPVFPCRSHDEMVNGEKRTAKSPLTAHGFEDASTNIGCIEEWFRQTPDALVGVPTGAASKLFVVDIDPAGAEWYRENAERLACGRVHKTRRGWHLLYRMPATPLSNSRGTLPAGVDVRGVGGYIVWWPAHGLEATGDLETLTEPPAWLVEALKKPKPAPSRGNGGAHRKYGEGERHQALLKFASSLRHKGVTGTPFEAALLAWNLENCAPPQNEADVRRIARDYIDKPQDKDLAQALDAVHTLRLNSMQEIYAAPETPKIPVLKDLLLPGAWLLTGRPKIGKSWLNLQLSLAVIEQGTFLGFSACVPGAEVLCIFAEDDNARIKSRLQSLGVANVPPGWHVINREQLPQLARRFCEHLSFSEFIEQWLVQHPAVRLVIVDTETVCRQVWAGERTSESMTRVTETDYQQTRAFDEVALRRNVVILLVNHAAKRKGEWVDIHELINRANTAFAGCSGSIALADPPDADPLDPKQKTRVLGVRGRDLKDDLLLAVHQREDMPYFVSDGEYMEVRQSQVEAELMEALEELMVDTTAGKYVTAEDLASCTGKSRGTVKRAITRMVSKGRTRWKKSRVTVKRGKKGGLRLDPVEE